MIQIPLFFLSFILRVIRVSVCAVSFHSNRITICLILSIDNKVGTNNIEFQRCPNVEISVQEIVYHSQLFYSILKVARNLIKLLRYTIVKPIPIRFYASSPWYTETLSRLYFWEIGFEWLPTHTHCMAQYIFNGYTSLVDCFYNNTSQCMCVCMSLCVWKKKGRRERNMFYES